MFRTGCRRSGKVKVLRKSDLKSQSLPPPEVLKDVERTLKPGHLKQGCTFWVTSLTVLIEEESPKAKQSKSNSEADQKPITPVTTEVKESEDVKAPSKPPEESNGVFNITTVSSRRRKSRATSGIKSIENDDSLLSKPQLMVSIPPSLKAWLVDDWDLITRQARLRDMVSCTKVDVNSLPVLEALVNEFLQFLRQNEGRYFRLEDYTVATAEYQRRAMC
uniref:Mortality factor 4-like protein 1 n=1 Tax=Schistosoma haematobium TaxID=6185 RepID=A0A094ZYU8_SCHHA